MTTEYHKIDSVFKRDPATKHKTFIEGDFARDEFQFLAENSWVWTEKVDGTNVRIIVGRHSVTFGGRTDTSEMPPSLAGALGRIFDPIRGDLLAAFPDGAVLYGEGYGAKIQKGGGNYRPDQGFALFDVVVSGLALRRESVNEIGRRFGLDVVPVVGAGPVADMVDFVSAGFKSTWGNFHAEGVVARPLVEMRGRDGRRVITKLKHRDFTSGDSR